ncbi:MAG: hypothetical protein PVJ95_13960 [Cellvibrionales bacterium]|jgi:hypothetical protein
MKVLETDQWCLLLPPEWRAEYDDDVVRIADVDDVGEMDFTTLCKNDGDVSPAELLPLARAESPEVLEWKNASVGAFQGVSGSFLEEGAFIREWYVSAGRVLLYITYCCDQEDADMDRAAVDDILSTLVAAAADD